MEYKILVVDDEPEIQTFIRISLVAEGFEYLGAASINSAQMMWETHKPHVVILDLGLPDGDGFSLLQLIRRSSKTPILILTARDQEEEKIRLLEAGANDYLSKPFGIRELIVRVKVLVRDLVKDQSNKDLLRFGQLTLKCSSHQCWLSDNEVELTKKEFAFMQMLLKAPGQLVKQADLLTCIWGRTHTEDTHYLRILVSQIRKKLNDSADTQKIIRTEAGIGYRLISENSLHQSRTFNQGNDT